ncbi:MAG: hypothetical protein DCC58_05045 [Chloroflexi bacterium]|nr:MAG: hypothetical protein DCC58_05045 [Chloroflexota bacterium]
MNVTSMPRVLTIVALALAVVAACGGDDTDPTATSTAPAPTATTASGGDLTPITVGYVPALVFAPVMIAHDKGYFAEYGLDVTLEPLPGGSDMVVLTANGTFDIGIGGAGPAFFNAQEDGIGLRVIGPFHIERAPQATPLMVKKARFDSGELTTAGDLKGLKVSVNARGATEYWLDTALRTDGLTIEDVDLQTLPFSDVAAALDSGAIDGAMLGEPLATMAEQQGIAVRLNVNFPADFQPTFVWTNAEFGRDNVDLTTGFMAGLMRGCRDLLADDWNNAENLAIIESYTRVPADLISTAARSYCEPNGEINANNLLTLQSFFMERGLLDYSEPLDVETFIDRTVAANALELIGRYDESQ